MTNIPEWLKAEEVYEPKKDNNAFMNKSIKSVMSVMSSFKRNNDLSKAKEAKTSLRLFAMLVMIVLTSVSKNFSFAIFMMAFSVVRVAFMNGEKIKAWLKTILPVLLFSALILLPSMFLGNPKTPVMILGKIFVSVTLVLVVNLTSSFNDITRALKAFHIPDVVIFTFDLAIKYIFILGDVCSKMLTALKIRSVGKNSDKKGATSGILGTVFIKAKAYADETNKAMECRGFNGEYAVSKEKFKLTKCDFITIILFVLVVGAFVYLEVIL